MPFEGLAGALLPPRPSPPVRAGAVAEGGAGHGWRMDLRRRGWDMPSKREEGRDWLGTRLLAGQLVTEEPDSHLMPPLSDLASD